MNLQHLLREFAQQRLAQSGETAGTEAAFAQTLGISASMLSQIKTHRPIGHRVARQIEVRLGLSESWLDEAREHQVAISPQQQKFDRLAHRLWTQGSARQKREAVSALMRILEGDG
jgi:hypothetical protein